MAKQQKTPTQSKASTRRPSPAAAATVGAATGAAARRRMAQRRREQWLRRMRTFEAVLPEGSLQRRSLRPGLRVPAVQTWRGWALLRNQWFWLALITASAVTAALVWVHTDERWFLYREDARFSGVNALDRETLWQQSGIDGWNLFWLDTGEVRRKLLANPYVADADVYVTPAEGTVTMAVTEARPVALWVTDNGTLWILPSGQAVVPIGPTPPGLMQIVDPKATATTPGVALGAAIDKDVLKSAESLLVELPKIGTLRYNRQIGLNFQLQDKPYWVYWGDGANVQRKLENLAAAERLLAKGDVEGSVIDVRFERPYVK